MPQFDLVSFFVQIFYAFLFFIAFYLFVLKYLIVRIAQVIKMRRKLRNYQQMILESRKNKKDSSKALYNAVIKYWK